jgi:restriction endonuclease S subunit
MKDLKEYKRIDNNHLKRLIEIKDKQIESCERHNKELIKQLQENSERLHDGITRRQDWEMENGIRCPRCGKKPLLDDEHHTCPRCALETI